MNLFELTTEYVQLLELAEDPDVDPEVLSDTMEGLTGEIEDKADSYACVINTIKGDIDVIDAEIKRLQARKKTLSNSVERIKNHLYTSMVAMDMRKIKTAKHSFSIAKNGGKIPVVYTADVDIDTLPAEFVKIEKSVATDAVRSYLEAGKELTFARLGERGESLRIK